MKRYVFLAFFLLGCANRVQRAEADVRNLQFVEGHGACWAFYDGPYRGGVTLVPDRFCK